MITPLVQIEENIYVKYEFLNESGSHKVRAAEHIISNAIQHGKIILGETTIIEKTGGNFGFGLIHACQKFNLDIELAIGLSYSKKKRNYLQTLGAKLIGEKMMEDEGKTPKEVVEYHLSNSSKLNKKYFYTDQFNNRDSINGHFYSTGPEIFNQLKEQGISNKIAFVACAGTGASLMGVSKALIKRNIDVDNYLVEPKDCNSKNEVFVDHRFEGMAVGVSPPFIEWDAIKTRIEVSLTEMLEEQKHFAIKYGQLIGNTSAACIHAARKVSKSNLGITILTIAYDHGLWYNDLIDQ